jgi:hypothetical protein
VSNAPLEVVEAPPPPVRVCTNCGNEKVEVFCAKCGEKQPDHHDVSLGHFFHELVHELLHLDSKLFRTLRVLITRPGQLTADYFAGRKTRYITPLRLFITFFALQLIAYTIYQPVAVYSMRNLSKFDPNVTRAFEKLAAKKKITVDQTLDRLDTRWQKNLSLLQFINLLGSAVVLKILYRRKRHFGEHMVFSAHYLTFAYLFSLALLPVYAITGIGLGGTMIAIMIVNNLVMITYLCLAIRRYYAQSVEKSIVKGVLAYIGTFLVSMVVMQISAVMAVIQVAKA